jgi:hypothetical protein
MRTIIVFAGEDREEVVEVVAPEFAVERLADEWMASTRISGADLGDPSKVAVDFLKRWPGRCRFVTEFAPAKPNPDQTLMIRCRAGEGLILAIQNKEA